MIKMMFLLRSDRNEPAADFRNRVVDEFLPGTLAGTKAPCKVTITSVDPPRLSLTPYRKDRVALVSIWESRPSRETAWAEKMHGGWRGTCHGYRVEESIPLAYERAWPAGAQTPGLGLLTLFRARRGLAHGDFLRMWHLGHTPLGMKVHPMWNYVRNVVLATLVPGTPDLDGIVEEHFRCDDDLLNPVRFFGGPARMVPNMARIGLDIRKWMDLGSIENYLVTEQWIRDRGE